jgi:hypothetical protein
VYAYSRRIGSAREIERRCEYDPAFQWLTGMAPVNYHTLADFRVEQGKELDQLFSDLLGVLSAERLITLEEVMQDGTKFQAQASGKTFRREKTLREHVGRARLQAGNDCHQLAPKAEQSNGGAGENRDRWWRMRVTPAGKTSRSWPRRVSISWGAWRGQCRQSQNAPTAVCGEIIGVAARPVSI